MHFSSTSLPPRWFRGLFCWAAFLIAPFGWFVPRRFFRHLDEARLDRGLVLILPGIEGLSFLNLSIQRGLLDAGVPYALDIVDWTTGNKFLALYHLRSWRRNLRVAAELAQRITAYRQQYPGRPVWLIGHSGGGAMALLTTRALPDDVRITGVVLLAAAASPGFDLAETFPKVERGVWSFHSWLDWFFVGIGTTLCGCLDGPHRPAAGMFGFRTPSPANDPLAGNDLVVTQTTSAVFEQTGYSLAMARQFHFGGHFGCVHRVFIAERVAPLLDERKTE
jgi:pimeloyl-ACP methyl ester carboxylesterase